MIAVLTAMARITLFLFTPLSEGAALKARKVASTKSPKKNVKAKVKGPKAGLESADRTPPTKPTYVAPALPTNSVERASTTA